MQMKRVGSLVHIAPLVVSLIGITTVSGYAAEVPSSETESTSAEFLSIAELPSLPHAPVDRLEPVVFKTTDVAIAAEPTLQFSGVNSSIVTEIVENQPETDTVVWQSWTDDSATAGWQISNHVVLNAATQGVEDETSQVDANAAVVFHPVFSLSESELKQSTSTLEDLSQAQFTPSTALGVIEDPVISAASSETQVQFISITLSELEQMTPEHWQIASWQIAQAEPSPESETPQTVPEAEESSSSPRWRFSIMPYAFVPLSVSGSATVRNFTADLDLGLSDILDPLNFALAGRAEAWRGNLGVIFDGAYFKLGQDTSTSLSVPNCFCNIFPSEIDTEVNVEYGQFDLGVGYRLGTNVSNAATEFDMGPMVFDAMIGMRIYTFQQEINISTNVGIDRNLEGSTTLVQPLVSGRVRWNASQNFAGWVRGDFAGFGIGGTLFAASVTGGVDWMFSGNTSLQLAYRFSSLQYNTDVRGQELGLNLVLHGPYMGVVFRF
jgi:opacity protein-like surface antigen